MKTTIDIPDLELADAMRYTGSKTKTDAVNAAIADFNRRKRVEEVTKRFGTFTRLATNDTIEAAQLAREEKRRCGAR